MPQHKRPTIREHFEIAILCALPLEASAVSILFDDDWDEGEEADETPYDKALNDPNAYSVGRIGRHDVVVAHMPGMGKVSAAVIASNCRMSWPNLRLGLVVGICGAVPFPGGKDIEMVLGDVVISSGVVQYDFGRQMPEQFVRKDSTLDSLGRPGFEIRGLLAKLKGIKHKKRLRTKMAEHLKALQEEEELQAAYPGVEHDRLYEPTYRHIEDGVSCAKAGCDGPLVPRLRLCQGAPPEPMVYFGLVASGDKVMKSGLERDMLAQKEDVVAFEMEGAGLWDVFPCLVIKGACDYADSHKTKVFQTYAAATAAAYAKAFLEFWVPSPRFVELRATTAQAGREKFKVWSLNLYTRNESFVNRESILNQLQYESAASTAQTRTVLFGLGGSGKTQIAIEYGYRAQEKDPSLSVFWVHASTVERFRGSCISLARKCAIPGHQDAKVDDVMKLTIKWIANDEERRWLMIIDNADDAELFQPKGALRSYIPECAHVSLFVTTRNKQAGMAFSKGKPLVEVSSMSHAESLELLCRNLGAHSLPNKHLEELSERLDRLPLALVQAASYIETQSLTVSAYLERLKRGDQRFVRLLSEDFDTVGRHDDSPRAVAETWVLSFEQIRRQSPIAAELLSIMCFYDKQRIPTRFLREHLNHENPKGETQDEDSYVDDIEDLLIKALGCLKAFSLVKEAHDTLDMHRLIQLVTRKWLQDQGLVRAFSTKAMFAMSDCFPEAEFKNIVVCGKYLPHAESVLQFDCTASREERLEKADLLHRMAHYLFVQGRWKDAKREILLSISINSDELGNDHADTLASIDILGMIEVEQGNLKEAEERQLKVLEVRRKNLGDHHDDTLASMCHLARTYRKQGRLEEAAEVVTTAVVERRYSHNSLEGQSQLSGLNTLALVLRDLGKHQEAEQNLLDVLAGLRAQGGPEDADIASVTANLGMVYQDQKRFAKAEEMLLKAFNWGKEHLGISHPETVTYLCSLALARWDLGREQEAIDMMCECLNHREKVLGSKHQETQYARQWLIGVGCKV